MFITVTMNDITNAAEDQIVSPSLGEVILRKKVISATTAVNIMGTTTAQHRIDFVIPANVMVTMPDSARTKSLTITL